MPDEPLQLLADANTILEPEVWQAELRRLLTHPKSRALAENFASQWLGLVDFDQQRPDPKLFPEFDSALANAMKEETIQFFHYLISQDRSVLELLDADFTFLNPRLAKHYGVEGITGEEFRFVSLSDRRRGGILTQASILTVTSYPHRTSPVLRGQFILQDILGAKVPPPPPNVPELAEHEEGQAKLTLRQKLELHRSHPNCAACHERMDRLGFGLENFDAVGRWRESDNDLPVDASGQLPDGATFQGPQELRQVLLQKQEDFLENFSRKLLGYALGRELNKYDKCVIEDCVRDLKRNDYKFSVLFASVVASDPFQYRYAAAQKELEEPD